MLTLLPRMDTKRWRSNQAAWSNLHTMCHPIFLAASAVEAELGALLMCV